MVEFQVPFDFHMEISYEEELMDVDIAEDCMEVEESTCSDIEDMEVAEDDLAYAVEQLNEAFRKLSLYS